MGLNQRWVSADRARLACVAETSADDEKYFRTVTVKITERYHLGGHESRERIEVIQISAENLHARAAAAVATYPTEVGTDPICVISHDRPPEGTFVSQEHFVPEGLGFGWAGLPRGTGTVSYTHLTLPASDLV